MNQGKYYRLKDNENSYVTSKSVLRLVGSKGVAGIS